MSTASSASRVGVEWCGQPLELCGDRGLWAPGQRTLYVADTHFGKPEHFRAAGRPVPEDVTVHDLARLGTLVDETGAERLVILGDLFHATVAAGGETLRAMQHWLRSRSELSTVLVCGNHDRQAGLGIAALGLETLTGPAVDGPFELRHEPPEAIGQASADKEPTRPVLCGHLHPAVRLRKPGGRGAGGGLRVACFWMSNQTLVLPAFGRFTGCRVIEPKPSDRVFAVGEGVPIEI